MACRRAINAIIILACGFLTFALLSLVPPFTFKRIAAGIIADDQAPRVSFATGADDWKNATMDMGSVVKSGNLTASNRVALLVIGHARSLVWDIVCENIKTRLVDALAKPGTDTAWKVDVFLFLSLVDADSRKTHSRLKQMYREEMLKPCIKKLDPIHVEFMPPTYQPPKEHGCSKGNEPEYIVQSRTRPKEKDYPTRFFSQCKRVDIAHEYILNVVEPKIHQQYAAVIKTRPDAIYLTDVPPLWSFNLSRITSAAGGYFDIFQLIPRGCRVSAPQCLQCADNPDTIDAKCNYPRYYMDGYFDSRVQPVLARATARAFFVQNRIKLPKQSSRKRKDQFGYLNLECKRWQHLMQKRAPGVSWKGVCEAEATKFLRAEPPK